MHVNSGLSDAFTLSTTTQINPTTTTVPTTSEITTSSFTSTSSGALTTTENDRTEITTQIPIPKRENESPGYILQQELYRIQLGVENKRLRESAAKETNARKGHEDAVENVELEIEYLEDQLAVSKSRIKDLQSTIRRMELGSV